MSKSEWFWHFYFVLNFGGNARASSLQIFYRTFHFLCYLLLFV